MTQILTGLAPIALPITAVIGLAILLLLFADLTSPAIPVKAKPLMTPRELEAFRHLCALLPEYHIAPQVAMGAIVQQKEGLDRSRKQSVRNTFDRKIVDFVAFDPADGKVAFLIEIDDSSHIASRDARRDAITTAAGYLTIRHPARAHPTKTALAATLRRALDT